jgi:hypothetical protein
MMKRRHFLTAAAGFSLAATPFAMAFKSKALASHPATLCRTLMFMPRNYHGRIPVSDGRHSIGDKIVLNGSDYTVVKEGLLLVEHNSFHTITLCRPLQTATAVDSIVFARDIYCVSRCHGS